MDVRVIEQIKEAFEKGQSYHKVMRAFNLNNAQGYAINVLGRDMRLSSSYLADRIDIIYDTMTMREIINILNLSLEEVKFLQEQPKLVGVNH